MYRPSPGEVPEPSTAQELRALVALAVPIALAQFAQILLSLTDTTIVGRTSSVALAGAGLGRALSFAFASILIGVAGALEPLASQALGAGSPNRAFSAFERAVRAVLWLSLPTLALIAGSFGVSSYVGLPADVSHASAMFLLGHAPAIPMFGLFLCARSFLQSHEKTRPIVIAAIVANLVNVPMCLLLVHTLRWGAFGAGLASTISTGVLTVVCMRAAYKLKPSTPIEAQDDVTLGTVLRLSFPIGLQFLAEIGVFSFVGVLAGTLGATAGGAHQIALNLASFTFMGALGISAATSTRVGLAVGQRRSPRRVGLLGIAVGTGFMALGATVFWLAPRLIAQLFSQNESVIAIAVPLLRIAALFQLFDGAQAVASGALRGIADVRFAFGANVVAHWFVGLPIAVFLCFYAHMGVVGLWWGLTAGLVTIALVTTARFALRAGQTDASSAVA